MMFGLRGGIAFRLCAPPSKRPAASPPAAVFRKLRRFNSTLLTTFTPQRLTKAITVGSDTATVGGWALDQPAISRLNQEEHAIKHFKWRQNRKWVNHVIAYVQMTSRFSQRVLVLVIDQIISEEPKWMVGGQMEVEPIA
jgi:hypothetical protein